MRPIEIRTATPGDREAIVALLRNSWGVETIVVHDTVYRPADLPAFVAVDGKDLLGLITNEPGIESWHVLSLNSLVPRRGTGSALLDRVEDAARAARCRRSRRRRPGPQDEAVDPLDRPPQNPHARRSNDGEKP